MKQEMGIQILSIILGACLLERVHLVSGNDFPQILLPKEVVDVTEPIVTLVPIPPVDANSVQIPCEVKGKHQSISWGKVSAAEPFLFYPVESPWIEEEDSISTAKHKGAEKRLILKLKPGAQVTAEAVRGLYRCRVIYKEMQVFSSTVRLKEAQYTGNAAGHTVVASKLSYGDVLLTCVNDLLLPHLSPTNYLSHFQSSWRLWNTKQRNVSYTTSNFSPNLETDGKHARVIEAGGALLFSEFRRSDIRLLKGFTWYDQIGYECSLVGNGRNRANFPVPQVGRYRVVWETIDRRYEYDKPKALRLVYWSNQTVVEAVTGELTVLYCVYSRGVGGFPVVRWKFNNAAGSEPPDWRNNSKARRSRNAHLEFVASVELEGTIECSVEGHEYLTKIFQYRVQGQLSLSPLADLSDKQMLSGKEAIFKCVLSIPTPVDWFHNGQRIQKSGVSHSISGLMNSELKVFNVTSQQSGSIVCSANNGKAPLFMSSARLLVIDPFKIHLVRLVSGREKESVSLSEALRQDFGLVVSFKLPEFTQFAGRWVLTKTSTLRIDLSAVLNLPHVTFVEPRLATSTGYTSAEIKFNFTSQAQAREMEGVYSYELVSDSFLLRSNSLNLKYTSERELTGTPQWVPIGVVAVIILAVISTVLLLIYGAWTLVAKKEDDEDDNYYYMSDDENYGICNATNANYTDFYSMNPLVANPGPYDDNNETTIGYPKHTNVVEPPSPLNAIERRASLMSQLNASSMYR